MHDCPKCSSKNISGPFYGTEFGKEWLDFVCRQCGYQRREVTHDNMPADRLIAKIMANEKVSEGWEGY